ECTTIRTKAVFMNGLGGVYRMSEDLFIRDPAREATLDELVAYCLHAGRRDDPEPHPEGTRFRKPITETWQPPSPQPAGQGVWRKDPPDNPYRQDPDQPPQPPQHRIAPPGWCPCPDCAGTGDSGS